MIQVLSRRGVKKQSTKSSELDDRALATYLKIRKRDTMDDGNLNVARYRSVPCSEMGPVVERALTVKEEEAVETWIALFRNRALVLVRNGSSSALREEAAMLNQGLYSLSGDIARKQNPEYHARLRMIADLVGEAGQRTDTIFLSALLSSHKNYAKRIVEMLAQAGQEGLPRKEILAKLRIEESHLSHVLADLEAADVVIRMRRSGTKEVRVVLGPAGRELIDETFLPKWFRQFVDFFAEAIEHRVVPDHDALLSILEKAKISRSLAAEPVKKLLALIRRAAVQPERLVAAAHR